MFSHKWTRLYIAQSVPRYSLVMLNQMQLDFHMNAKTTNFSPQKLHWNYGNSNYTKATANQEQYFNTVKVFSEFRGHQKPIAWY